MVGVLNRVLTMAGMPLIMKSEQEYTKKNDHPPRDGLAVIEPDSAGDVEDSAGGGPEAGRAGLHVDGEAEDGERR